MPILDCKMNLQIEKPITLSFNPSTANSGISIPFTLATIHRRICKNNNTMQYHVIPSNNIRYHAISSCRQWHINPIYSSYNPSENLQKQRINRSSVAMMTDNALLVEVKKKRRFPGSREERN